MPKITAADITQMAKDALKASVTEFTDTTLVEYEQWAEQVAPVITEYAVLAATGDAKAVEILGHLRAQAEAKAWAMAITAQSTVKTRFGDVVTAVATTAATIVGGFVKLYGPALISLAAI